MLRSIYSSVMWTLTNLCFWFWTPSTLSAPLVLPGETAFHLQSFVLLELNCTVLNLWTLQPSARNSHSHFRYKPTRASTSWWLKNSGLVSFLLLSSRIRENNLQEGEHILTPGFSPWLTDFIISGPGPEQELPGREAVVEQSSLPHSSQEGVGVTALALEFWRNADGLNL